MKFISKIFIFLCLMNSFRCGDLDSSQLGQEQVTPIQGEKGATGAKGDTGTPAKYASLFDQAGTEIGSYLERVDFDNGNYAIITIEGYRAVIDIDDGSYQPLPQLASGFGFSCLYTTNDCSGDCYGVDIRARGSLLKGQSGLNYYVDQTTATSNITANSRNAVGSLTTCTVGAVPLPTAIKATAYTGVLSKTLSTPLYFKVKN